MMACSLVITFSFVPKPPPGPANIPVRDVTLVLDMSLDDELLSKGLARDIIRRVQAKRKEMDLRIEAEIALVVALGPESPQLAEEDWNHILNETRAISGKKTEDLNSTDLHFVVDGATIGFTVSQT